jgi:hypothetical protein
MDDGKKPHCVEYRELTWKMKWPNNKHYNINNIKKISYVAELYINYEKLVYFK